jgi:hypothetical protein
MVDTLSDPDASGWEKFFAVLSGGTMALSMTVSSINSFSNAVKNFKGSGFGGGITEFINSLSETIDEKVAAKEDSNAELKAFKEEKK